MYDCLYDGLVAFMLTKIEIIINIIIVIIIIIINIIIMLFCLGSYLNHYPTSIHFPSFPVLTFPADRNLQRDTFSNYAETLFFTRIWARVWGYIFKLMSSR